MNSLLIELLTEELPPKALKKLGEAFAHGIAQGLAARKLSADQSIVTPYATPRRLAVHITHVAAQSPAQARRDKVLPVAVAFDAQGTPQPPLLKKLAALGLSEADIPALEKALDGKAEALFHNHTAPGVPLAQALQEMLTDTIAKLPIPKVMFYERDDGTAVNFVRPAHQLVALYGAQVLAVSALGVQAGNTTLGHRFHSSGAVQINDADSYAATLNAAHVMASYAERRASIQQQLSALAKGDDVIAPEALLDEVNSLVEWPRVYECHFDKEFLDVPQECLILTMQTNQKYFATQKNGKLTNRFLVVSNIETATPNLIIGGNERVVRPRLADAKFFFDQDRKQTLESRLPKLANVVYHGKLGSQFERVKRIESIAEWIASKLNADTALAKRAALLSKADLVTDMVAEFPELQGIMGGYYALNDGEDELVAEAISAQYVQRKDDATGTGDAAECIESAIQESLFIADRVEILVGMWGVGLKPTGDKDPFALRRAALSLIHSFELLQLSALIEQTPIDLDFKELLSFTSSTFPKGLLSTTVETEVIDFVYNRYLNQLAPNFGFENVASVISTAPPLQEVVRRVKAVQQFRQLPDADPLAAANKRISNILKKSDAAVGKVDETKLVEDAEKHLYKALNIVEDIAKPLFHNGEYAASLRELASLRGPVDAFFDKVMVNAEDPALRANRLALLQSLHTAMNRVADLSKLAA
jgi:glycyl-tRNA synthetase beta chain